MTTLREVYETQGFRRAGGFAFRMLKIEMLYFSLQRIAPYASMRRIWETHGEIICDVYVPCKSYNHSRGTRIIREWAEKDGIDIEAEVAMRERAANQTAAYFHDFIGTMRGKRRF